MIETARGGTAEWFVRPLNAPSSQAYQRPAMCYLLPFPGGVA